MVRNIFIDGEVVIYYWLNQLIKLNLADFDLSTGRNKIYIKKNSEDLPVNPSELK